MPLRRLTLHAVFLLCLAGFAATTAVVVAETSCYSASCATSCDPTPPVAISPLVESSDFPAATNDPVAFVDLNDGRGKYLIATQEGAILVWDGPSGSMLPDAFLDLRDDVGGPVLAGGERGLLALVVDPDYASNGLLYVFYTSADVGPGTTGDIVIASYERSAVDPDLGDPGSETRLLVIDHPAGNHNGGWLAFGPDGFLYISTGDGGGGCDSNQGINGDGQRINSLAGKMLRIDVRGIDGSATAPDDCGVSATGYTVPSDNPFTGMGMLSCDEVWALGLRNPFRFSFDRDNGDLYIGDVGQNKWEEINLKRAATPAPVNFGWVCREGCETSNNDESFCPTTGCPVDTGTTCEFPRASGFWDPVLCHYNGGWDSIMGGYRYRGVQVPSLAGDYLYGDAACGQIWKTDVLDPANPAAIAASCWASGYHGTYGFAEDSQGELYVVLGAQHRIDCIHNGDGCTWVGGAVFSDGFESGDTTAW